MKMKLELSVWNDGTLRLVYWDSYTGDDVVLIINDDGTAHKVDYDENENEQKTLVNLAPYLRLMLEKFAAT